MKIPDEYKKKAIKGIAKKLIDIDDDSFELDLLILALKIIINNC